MLHSLIWWTALSVALGLDIRGDIIRGVPCVKRYHQLFCPTAGNSYPIDKIEKFIDDNKALMRRMYGDFEMSTQYGPPSQTSSKKRKRHTDNFDFDVPGVPDFIGKPGFEPDADTKGESYFNKWRPKRQTQSFRNTNNNSNTNNSNSNRNNNSNTNRNQSERQAANANNNSENTGRVDACESKVEIVTPYWASNSAGKIRAIVNTQHFEQAIHQEVCVKVQTNRCGGDCGCEQKYKWHRLLAYDPDNDCKGIFMDWFLFPSCCVCRCNP